jgi:alpha-tubulin suppressor-like RCC1 family protein
MTTNKKGSFLRRFGDIDYVDDISIVSIDQIFAGYYMSFFLKDKKLYGDWNCNMELHWLKDMDITKDNCNPDFREIFMSRERTKKTIFNDGEKINIVTDDYQPFNGFKSISCGYYCVFIITIEGLFACGKNYNGQLGVGDRNTEIRGLKKIKLNNVLKVSCGKLFNMLLTKEGLFSCGLNRFGRLGIGSSDNDYSCYSFTKINLQNVIDVECGANHSLALTTDGLYACGFPIAIRPFSSYNSNYNDLKGDIQDVVSFKCGSDFCLILTQKGLYGCGKSQFGQLGFISEHQIGFIKIDINNVISFDCGKYHSIINTTEGLFGCGSNHKGQLGLEKKRKQNQLVKIM